jgi:hypothetical protein
MGTPHPVSPSEGLPLNAGSSQHYHGCRGLNPWPQARCRGAAAYSPPASPSGFPRPIRQTVGTHYFHLIVHPCGGVAATERGLVPNTASRAFRK